MSLDILLDAIYDGTVPTLAARPVDLVERFGITLTTREGPTYLPGDLRADHVVEFGELVHEVCHYVVATPRQRQMANYGLGMSPADYLNTSIDPRIRDIHITEYYVGVLSAIYTLHFDSSRLLECIEFSGIIVAKDEPRERIKIELAETFFALEALGLITDGEPTFAVNQSEEQLEWPPSMTPAFYLDAFLCEKRNSSSGGFVRRCQRGANAVCRGIKFAQALPQEVVNVKVSIKIFYAARGDVCHAGAIAKLSRRIVHHQANLAVNMSADQNVIIFSSRDRGRMIAIGNASAHFGSVFLQSLSLDGQISRANNANSGRNGFVELPCILHDACWLASQIKLIPW